MVDPASLQSKTLAAADPSRPPLRQPQRVVLAIAGFDPSSGAGVSADLQTFAAHGLFGTAVTTALTVQSTLGVAEVQPVDAGFIQRSLSYLTDDLAPSGVKIGMLASAEMVDIIAEFVRTRAGRVPVVLDPVLASSSGHGLFPPAAFEALAAEMLPWVGWITPNWKELGALTGDAVHDLPSAEQAAAALGRRHPHLVVVATGGESERPVDLLRLPDGTFYQFPGEHIETRSTHGTGCAFSSALLARLVLGESPIQAVAAAKRFVEGALRRASGLGSGRGPMDLLWPLRAARPPAENLLG